MKGSVLSLIMKRTPVVPISDALNSWLSRRPYIREGLMEQRLMEVFNECVAPIKQYINSAECRKRIIYVRFSSSAVRHEMTNRKQEFIRLINTQLETDFLIDINMS